MRFGVHYLPTYIPALDGPYAEFYRRMFEQIGLIEKLGFSDVWVTEHHFHEYGGALPHPPTFLAAAARSTEKLRLGVAISVLPFHHPIDVAESYAMVDVISNGRLEFGMGRGTEEIEFKRYGQSREHTAKQLREGAELILQAWSQETLEFHGELWNYSGIRVLPTPVQRPHPPIWVGASGTPETYAWAGQRGFNLMTLPYLHDPLKFREMLAGYRHELVRNGFDPSSRELLGKFHIYVSESDRTAREEANPYWINYRACGAASDPSRNRNVNSRDIDSEAEKGNMLVGDAQRVIELIQKWQEDLQLTTLSGTFFFGGMPQEMAVRNLRLFADKVMPAFA